MKEMILNVEFIDYRLSFQHRWPSPSKPPARPQLVAPPDPVPLNYIIHSLQPRVATSLRRIAAARCVGQHT